MKKTFKPSGNLSSSIFFTFLKQNKAYDLFMRNFSNSDLSLGIAVFNYDDPSSYISNAFCWAHTSEGADYWRLLDDKWNLVVSLFNF